MDESVNERVIKVAANEIWDAAHAVNGLSPRGALALARRLWGDARRQSFEEAAALHESISPHCEHEPGMGAGAIGAVIRYRDAIRELAATYEPVSGTGEGGGR
jgi:hypothetical protein